MTYQIGAASSTLVNADTVFGKDPKSTPIPGGERSRVMDGTDVYIGYPRSVWEFAFLTVTQYRKALAILCSTAGAGTLTGITSSTNIDGTTTAFNTELQVSDLIAAHKGSGVYEIMTIATITDADTLNVAANPATAFTNVAFRYRRKNVYSAGCYVQTRNDLDAYQSYQAIVRFPEPDKLARWGNGYEKVAIEFVLVAVV